jgi:hypothetical protein
LALKAMEKTAETTVRIATGSFEIQTRYPYEIRTESYHYSYLVADTERHARIY